MTTSTKAPFTLLIAALFAPACGESSSASQTSLEPKQTVALSCGLETSGCPAPAATSVSSTDLTPSSSAVTLRVSAADYWPSTPSGCAGTFVAEIPPEKLTGSQLEIESAWDRDQAVTDANGADACREAKADIVVYGRATASEAWRVIDFRTLAGTAAADATCEVAVVDHGAGEAGLPNAGIPIWLTPARYAGGLRVAVVAAAACNPLPVVVKIAEDFK